ncbi:hypothetical protein CYMTET_50114 [Cymbomonas tetramitiformis]|uniref:tRNA/rRNA methyltransferase SpoU type domain-containing protein n=1 Tax=Cymbomonas tetramitiformis TaxID=36881 RepID=A0AAE0BQF3_9CHLO|nr:hypothetical protein CYMTET_50114 [Cymbomonas tetramitiformis]
MFVHQSAVQDEVILRRGDFVVVDTVETPKGEEVGSVKLHVAREESQSVVAQDTVHRLREAAVLAEEVEELKPSFLDPERFSVAAERLCAIAEEQPQNFELIRFSVFPCIQHVDRHVARASENLAVSTDIVALYKRALSADWCLSREQREAIDSMLQLMEAYTQHDHPRNQMLLDPPDAFTDMEPSDATSSAHERLSKANAVLKRRTLRFVLVLEGVADVVNKYGIYRCAEALGVQEVWSILPAKHKVSKNALNAVSKKAQQWLTLRTFTSTSDCIDAARAEGREIWVTHLHANAVPLEAPLTLPERMVMVMGAEHAGVSQEMLMAADKVVYLPMCGFVESLNVMVAAALVIQRLFDLCPEAHGDCDPCERDRIYASWTKRILAKQED